MGIGENANAGDLTLTGGESGTSMRVVVIGTPGSGKTTLARRIAQVLEITYIEADQLQYDTNWERVSDEDFRELVPRSLTGESWVADGNFDAALDLVWSRATNLVWLDYSITVSLSRIFNRILRRVVTTDKLWRKYSQRFWSRLQRKAILFKGAVDTHNNRRRKNYPVLLQLPEYSHLKVVRLRSPSATKKWLSGLELGQSQNQGSHRGGELK